MHGFMNSVNWALGDTVPILCEDFLICPVKLSLNYISVVSRAIPFNFRMGCSAVAWRPLPINCIFKELWPLFLSLQGASKNRKAPDGSSYLDRAEGDEVKALLKWPLIDPTHPLTHQPTRPAKIHMYAKH